MYVNKNYFLNAFKPTEEDRIRFVSTKSIEPNGNLITYRGSFSAVVFHPGDILSPFPFFGKKMSSQLDFKSHTWSTGNDRDAQ